MRLSTLPSLNQHALAPWAARLRERIKSGL